LESLPIFIAAVTALSKISLADSFNCLKLKTLGASEVFSSIKFLAFGNASKAFPISSLETPT